MNSHTCEKCGGWTNGYHPDSIATYDCRCTKSWQYVDDIQGTVSVTTQIGQEFDADGFPLRPRFNCNFERKSGLSTLHKLHSLLNDLSGQKVKITIERLAP